LILFSRAKANAEVEQTAEDNNDLDGVDFAALESTVS